MTDEVQSGTGLERDLIQNVAEVEYHVMWLGVFLRCARYGPIDRLAYPRIVSGCDGGGALLYVPLGSVRSWYALRICQLIYNMAVDSVSTIGAIARLTNSY